MYEMSGNPHGDVYRIRYAGTVIEPVSGFLPYAEVSWSLVR